MTLGLTIVLSVAAAFALVWAGMRWKDHINKKSHAIAHQVEDAAKGAIDGVRDTVDRGADRLKSKI